MAYGFAGLESIMAEWENAWDPVYILIHSHEAERDPRELYEPFETSDLSPSHTPLRTRPHLLNLPKLFHQLEIKYSYIWAFGNILILIITFYSLAL